jgi:hypothetical protein|uniref:Uncharacterized protein n=1 Tax=viral metagenome TaxID=1070528 RepID=A0A6C0H1W5_9ZZZZ
MSSMVETVFGPLDKKYCNLFYFLSIANFVFLVILVVVSLWIGISKKKGLEFFISAFSGVFLYGILYLQNRLLYSMCTGEMK